MVTPPASRWMAGMQNAEDSIRHDETEEHLADYQKTGPSQTPCDHVPLDQMVDVAGLLSFVDRCRGDIRGLLLFQRRSAKNNQPQRLPASIVTTVYSDDNHKIAEFYKERRIVVPLSKIPVQLQQAFIAAEDSRFYKHQGIDFFSIVRAFIKNLEAGTIVQGGSTITQQVTKSFLLSPERSYERKIKEAILAYRIDKTFSKEEILFYISIKFTWATAPMGLKRRPKTILAKPSAI